MDIIGCSKSLRLKHKNCFLNTLATNNNYNTCKDFHNLVISNVKIHGSTNIFTKDQTNAREICQRGRERLGKGNWKQALQLGSAD